VRLPLEGLQYRNLLREILGLLESVLLLVLALLLERQLLHFRRNLPRRRCPVVILLHERLYGKQLGVQKWRQLLNQNQSMKLRVSFL
jgi:hypothetical protein